MPARISGQSMCFRLRPEVFFFQFRQNQKVRGQIDQAVGMAQDHVQVFAGVPRRFFAESLGIALDSGERRAQFMRNVGDEILFCLFQLPGFGKIVKRNHRPAGIRAAEKAKPNRVRLLISISLRTICPRAAFRTISSNSLCAALPSKAFPAGSVSPISRQKRGPARMIRSWASMTSKPSEIDAQDGLQFLLAAPQFLPCSSGCRPWH